MRTRPAKIKGRARLSERPGHRGQVAVKDSGNQRVNTGRKVEVAEKWTSRSNHPASRRVGDGAVRALVSLSTEALRLLGVGSRSPNSASKPTSTTLPPPSSLSEFIEKLRDDYDRMYFVTGFLADELYTPHCRFADPTISFEGLELYKSNLRLLIPFLKAPEIRLKGIEVVDVEEESDGTAKVRAAWTLSTGLKLPWRPHIFVNGTTEYDLVGYQVVQHVERWDIDVREAALMVLGLFQNANK